MGPLDEPTFPDGSAPEGFWDDSAEQVFKAAREIVDLAETCQKRKKMPMSALVVFAVWTAAFVGIYAWHFPQLDVQRHMFSVEETCRIQGRRSRGDKDRGYRVATHGPTSIAYTALKSMSNYLHMASTYVKYFHDMDLFYEGVKNDYLAHLEQNGGDAAERMSVRQGGNGGGLDEWKLYGPKVTNNGTILLAEDTPAEGSELSREAIRSDKDNETAESDLTPAKDHSLKPRWIAPAGSSATIAMASPVAISSTGEHQPATGTVGDTIMKDRNNGIVAEVPTAPDGTMHGIVYGDESDAQFSQGNIGSGSANSGSLQPNEAQKWNTFSHATEQLHQMSYLDSQNAMPFAQVDSLDSTPPDVLLGDDSVNDFREFFNLNIAESQGMRWENVPATSINRFAEGGPEVEYVEGNMPLVYIGMADTYGM
ncbi:hypothetical protein SBRCBS47491_008111 [Sporothrix bragantina]|uniref:C6 zinc finger domain containing protein n=1 Tax=Sporothrix bragantina TaxID=671064 RepID=A0ABP0CIP0_9PEZI